MEPALILVAFYCSGKYRLLNQLVARGADAPGLFLVNPHASLADGFLHTIDLLPPHLRELAIQSLRIITPDHEEVVHALNIQKLEYGRSIRVSYHR